MWDYIHNHPLFWPSVIYIVVAIVNEALNAILMTEEYTAKEIARIVKQHKREKKRWEKALRRYGVR